MEPFEQFIRAGTYLRGWQPRTAKTYRQAWQSYTRFQQSLPEGTYLGLKTSPTKAQLEAWVIWLKETGCTNAGCNMYIRTMNSYTSWLHEETGQPKLRLKLLAQPTKPLRGFSDIEIRSLLSFRPVGFYQLRTFTLINTLLDTGCRIDELLMKLKRSEVDLENLMVRVFGKGGKERYVPISLELRKILFRYSNTLKLIHGDLLFCTRNGSRLSYRNAYRDIKNLCAKAGVSGPHVHPHAFRHFFAVTYIRRGGDIYRLSRILGHSSISTTQLYLRSMGIEQIGENHSSLSPLTQK